MHCCTLLCIVVRLYVAMCVVMHCCAGVRCYALLYVVRVSCDVRCTLCVVVHCCALLCVVVRCALLCVCVARCYALCVVARCCAMVCVVRCALLCVVGQPAASGQLATASLLHICARTQQFGAVPCRVASCTLVSRGQFGQFPRVVPWASHQLFSCRWQADVQTP